MISNSELLAFMLGMITATIAGLLGILLAEKKIRERKKQHEALDSVEQRMRRLKQIAKEQLQLAQQTDGPQKNALHGKHKNSIINEIKRLDEEKNDILRSILTDGHDPDITTMDEDGNIEKMKLSEYAAYLGLNMSPPKEEPKKSRAEQHGKFTVIRGGKDDGSGDTTH